jgi:hypothetical protein
MARMTVVVAVAILLTGRHQPTQTDTEWLSGWSFAAGNRHETLRAGASDMPRAATLVTLPHRLLEPNRALWYARDLDIPAGSALVVEADDGAQVFVDGARLSQRRRAFFVPDSSQSRRRVVIRVLNNAMQGGLRSVRAMRAADVGDEPFALPSLPVGFPPVDSAAFLARMPAAGEACRFTAWADSQGGWQTFGSLVDLMRRRRSHFSVGIGDLVNDGSDVTAWQSFLTTLAPLAAEVPVVPIAGNHDYDGFYNLLRAERYEAWFDRRDTTWFAWSCGPLRLAAVDLNREFPIGISEGSPQWRWLEAETASPAWTRARWRILLVHQPPWSKSWAGYYGDESIRRIVERLAESHGLDVVIAGHSHAYEHLVRGTGLRRVHVFITGGAGGALEDAAADALSTPEERIAARHHFVHVSSKASELTFEAVDTDGALLDRVVLRR